jgi:YHS domain-containing protein
MNSARILSIAVAAAVLIGGHSLRAAIAQEAAKEAVCPVMGSKFKVGKDTQFTMVNGQAVYFCCAGCPEAFAKEPEKYVQKVGALTCPVMDDHAVKPAKSLRILVNDGYYYVCCAGCPSMLVDAPEKYVTYELSDPVSKKLFKISSNQPHVEYKGVHYYFADAQSKATFEKSPDKFARKVN